MESAVDEARRIDDLDISPNSALFAPGSGTLMVGHSMINSGHLHATGEIFNGAGNGMSEIYNDLNSAVTTTRTLTGPASVDFGYCDLAMDFASTGSVSYVAVTRHQRPHPSAPSGISGTGVYWDLRTDGAGFDVSLKLPHDAVSDPYVCRYSGIGESWIPNRSRFDASFVELDGVTEFSTWAVGDASLGPVPVSLSSWSAD